MTDGDDFDLDDLLNESSSLAGLDGTTLQPNEIDFVLEENGFLQETSSLEKLTSTEVPIKAAEEEEEETPFDLDMGLGENFILEDKTEKRPAKSEADEGKNLNESDEDFASSRETNLTSISNSKEQEQQSETSFKVENLDLELLEDLDDSSYMDNNPSPLADLEDDELFELDKDSAKIPVDLAKGAISQSESTKKEQAEDSNMAQTSQEAREQSRKKAEKTDQNDTTKTTQNKPLEKEDGEISGTNSNVNKQLEAKQKQSTQRQAKPHNQNRMQQNQQLSANQQASHNPHSNVAYNNRGRGGRRPNNFRPNNMPGTLENGLPPFPGFGPGMEGMHGMQINQVPMNNPNMFSEMLPIHGPIIGPNIHINPNFARMRPRILPFSGPMSQFPIGAGGPPMNMMPFQGQMEAMYQHPIPQMSGVRETTNSYVARGSTQNHASNSPRRPQPTTSSSPPPKRKSPMDGFEQKEVQANKRSISESRKPESAASSSSNTSATASTAKEVRTIIDGNDNGRGNGRNDNNNESSSSIIGKNNATRNIASNNATRTIVGNNIARKFTGGKATSSTASTGKSASTVPVSATKRTPATLASASISPTSRITRSSTEKVPRKTAAPYVAPKVNSAKTSEASKDSGTTKLTIENVHRSVTRLELQEMAAQVPGGVSSVDLNQTTGTAIVSFRTAEGAKIFRRKFNRCVLGGVNIVVNYVAL